MELVNESTQYDAPAGEYLVEFVGVEERKPFEGPSKYGNSNEPRLAWKFKVLEGPLAGQYLEQNTGRSFAQASALTALLTMMLGRRVAPGERVQTESLLGRRYRLSWAINPKSEKGRCHVAGLTPLPGGAVAGATTPPPPPPNRPTTVAEASSTVYWVVVEEGQTPVQRDRAGVEALIREKNLDPDYFLLMPLGKAHWVPASSLGFDSPNPF
jgi:hypothetical protein